MSNELSILIRMANRADIRVVSRLLAQYELPFRVCPDSGALGAEAAADLGALLLEEEVLTGEVLEKLEAVLDGQPLWSELPVVLLVRSTYGRRSQRKSQSLFDRHPNLTIIERPVSSASLISVLRSALEARRRQYQVRDLLGDLRRSNRELEKRLRQSAVTRFTDIMLVYLDPDFNFVWVNPPYAENTGMPPEELVGKNHFDLFPDPDNEAIFKKVRDSGEPVFYKDHPFEFPDRPAMGVTYWDWSLTPEKGEEGKIEGLILSLRETTRYKKAQLALEESETRFRSIAEISIDIIFRVDPEGRITFVSPAVGSWGYEPEKLLHRHFSEFITGEDLPMAQEALQRVFGGEQLSLIEMKMLRADRREVEIEVGASPVFREGRVVEVQGIARDIGERKRLEKRVERSRQELEETVERRTMELEETHKKLLHAEKLSAIGRFSASIAHEINNPLFGIRNVIADLKQNEALPEEEVELAEMALEECDRIKRLIKDLQDFNRPSSGVVAPLDIHQAIDSVLSLTHKALQNKNIEVAKDYSPDMVEIQGIYDQLKQVILNLINNAVDAIPESGGWIEISTEVLFDKVIVVEIADSGAGIDSEEAKQIFEPFFSTKEAVKGTGLGLSVCYGIVTRHGGNIFFKSEPENGSIFTVILPIEGPPNE
ncbi:MAG: PAS domain S-box protein [Desulfurivibrionaceae bacterium]